jgi:hypothetical protein
VVEAATFSLARLAAGAINAAAARRNEMSLRDMVVS